MSKKQKGIAGERELVHMFWGAGWACLRIAGSGSTSFPAPDIIAGNKLRRVAIESKVTKSNSKYIPKEEIKQIKNFSDYFGAEAWIAVKLQKDWFFLNPEDLNETPSSFGINRRLCEMKGIKFEEFVTY